MTMTRDVATIERLESEVRSYSRLWPTIFATAEGSTVVAADGKRYLDFFAGAGALNYGHNHPVLRDALIAYLHNDGIVHGLDAMTEAKIEFLEKFDQHILTPRGLSYRVQFCGPTGTNAVEAAIKLARKVTGRDLVIAFTNGFHGMTLGALAATGSRSARLGAGRPLDGVARFAYDGYLGPEVDTLDLLEMMLADPSSGLDEPAGVIVETTQAEGGVNRASDQWLQRLQSICHHHGMLLIVDDIQVGIGRTGPFFSFERAGLTPDFVCLSKSLSGIGLPLAVVLIAEGLDQWSAGEHNGTFRGNNAAFVAASAALDHFWADNELVTGVSRKGEIALNALIELADGAPDRFVEARGCGLIAGLECVDSHFARSIIDAAFERGLILELAGNRDQMVKLLPPLTIDDGELRRGLGVLSDVVEKAARRSPHLTA
jgi:diaminobutyrate-2-oxoglutarate transaminase